MDRKGEGKKEVRIEVKEEKERAGEERRKGKKERKGKLKEVNKEIKIKKG